MTREQGSLASVDQLINRYPFVDDSLSDGDIMKTLEEANQFLQRRVGEEIETVEQVLNSDADTFQLTFYPVLDFVDIYLNGEKIDEADYTVKDETGVVEFDSSYDELNVYDQLRFIYTPEILVDMEIAKAMLLLAERRRVNTGAEETSTLIDRLKDRVKEYVNTINTHNPPVPVQDHNPHRSRS